MALLRPLDSALNVVALPSRIAAKDIEDLASTTEGLENWFLELSRTHDCDFAAEARLLGWLARDRRRGVTLRLPEIVDPTGEGTPGLRNMLTETLAGYLTCRFAQPITDKLRRDVSATVDGWQREALTSRTIGSDGQNIAFLIDDSAGGLGAADFIDTRGQDFSRRMAGQLADQLRTLGLTDGMRLPPDSHLLLQTRRFLTETLENTQKHATRDLNSQAIRGVRFLHVRRRFLRELVKQADAAGRGSGQLPEYLATLSDLVDGANVPLVEFTVADSGVGIAAHVRQSMSVYRGLLGREVDALREAFAVPPRHDPTWEGYGLPKAQLATRALGGFLMVRSGRLLASQHHLNWGLPKQTTYSLADAVFELTIDRQQ